MGREAGEEAVNMERRRGDIGRENVRIYHPGFYRKKGVEESSSEKVQVEDTVDINLDRA
jgi:hypothetical protein